mgnify:CR=1 FL=1
MEQAAQTFSTAMLAIPALLTLIPILLLIGGYQLSRKQMLSFAGKSMYWLAGHGVTLVLVSVLVVLRGLGFPDWVIYHLPLLITALYLFMGVVFRSAFIFSLGLATPGLWLFIVKGWEAFTGEKVALFHLPQEPFWYLLAAVVIFGLQYLSKPRDFWEDAEASLLVISCSYLMGGLWLLSLGQQSLLSGIGIAQYIWAILLVAVSAFFLWCGKYLKDPLFVACSVIGVAAGVYTFISFYPWA